MTEKIYIQELQERIAGYSDMKAYERLYKLLFKSLFKFAFSFVKSREAAEEIVSDAFIKLWQMGTRLNAVGNIKAYLFTVVKNFSLNYITQHYKQILLNIDEMDFDDIITWNDPEEILMSGENINRIKMAIKALPPQCRIIFQLVKEEGLSYKETAEVLDISVSTVRNQMAIGLRKMAESLPPYSFAKNIDVRKL